MKSAAVIRHIMFEDLGSFYDVLKSQGFDIQYIEAGVDNIDTISNLNPDLLIILGGPISVNSTDDYPWLVTEIDIIKYRLKNKLPTIGICLGAQLIAKACGEKVYGGHVKEIGWDTISITGAGNTHPLNLLKDTPVLHWHGETFTLPGGASLIASSKHYENQAFIMGNYCLGLQFHPEAMREKMELWLVGHTMEIEAHPEVSVSILREQTFKHADKLQRKAPTFWEETLKYMNLTQE